MPKHTDNSVSGIIRSKADQMSYRWLPVQRKPDNNTSLGVDISRSLVEEVGFFPSKVMTLAGIFRSKGLRQPGLLFWLYTMAIFVALVLPVFIMQGVFWQIWRTMKVMYRVVTGDVTYMDKEKVLPKNK